MAVKSKARHDLTLRSIKREISAGRDVAFWLDKAYAHLDSGLFDETDIAEVEELAAAYYDGLDAADQPEQTPEQPKPNPDEAGTDSADGTAGTDTAGA